MASKQVPIELNLRLGADPIEGSLRVRDERPQRFRGWLQLSGLLRAAADGSEYRTQPQKGDG